MKKSIQYVLPAAIAIIILSFVPLLFIRQVWIDRFLISTGLAGVGVIIFILLRKAQKLSIREKFLQDCQNFELLVSSIEDYAIFLLDKKGLVASWNSGAEKIKGFTCSDIIGEPTHRFYTDQDIQAGLPQGNLKGALRLGHMETEGWRLRKDRSLFFANIVITALFDGKNSHYGYAVITKDITKQKRTAATLLYLNNELEQRVIEKTTGVYESEKKYRYLFENNPVPMYVMALDDFAILDVNERACWQYGYSRQAFLSMSGLDLLPAEDIALFKKTGFYSLLQEGKYNQGIWRHCRQDATIMMLEIIANNIMFEGNKAILVYANDVTERIASEQKLISGEEQFRNTLDNMLEGIQIHDRDWRYIYVNRALVRYANYSNAELLGHTLMDKYPGIEGTELFKTLQRCMNERLALHFETEFVFPDGLKKDFQLSIQPVPEGLFILSIDITKRKKAEEKLITSEENYRSIMERVSDGFAAIDKNWHFSYVNKKGAAILQHTPQELITKNIWMEFPEATGKLFHTAFYNAMKEQHYIQLEEYFGPFELWLEIHIYPSADGLSVFFRDISERKKSEQQREFDGNNLYALINNTGDLMWSVARDFTLITCNQAFAKVFGALSGNAVKNGDAVLAPGFSPGQLEIFKGFYERAFAGESFTTEHSGFTGDNWSEISFHPISEGKMIIGTACFSRDITERKIAEGLLITRLAEKKVIAARMQAILNTLPASIALLDDKGSVIDVNGAWRNGTDSNGFTGNAYKIGDNYMDCSKHGADEKIKDQKEVAKGVKDVLSNKIKELVYEYDCDEPEIKKCYRMVATPLLGKESAGAVIMHIDITELRRLEQEKLINKVEQQKSIARAMLQAQEKERNHIGLELHDNVSQLLAAIRMKLQIAVSGKEANKAIVKECIHHVEEAIVETRNLSHRMVMPRFANSSFLEAIEGLAAIYRIPSRTIQLETGKMDESIVSPGIKETLYRIAQEQLNNINKYSQATAVLIRTLTNNGAVNMQVSDNGVGFNTVNKKNGIGLINIKNRSESYNGTATIFSSPGEGCCLTIHIPLDRPALVSTVDASREEPV